MMKVFVFIWLILLSSGVVALFWYNEWRYALPTPIPENYSDVAFGKQIVPGKNLDFKNTKPLFLHFFNPDCPCSRFNIKHFKSLIAQYNGDVNFAVVLLTDKHYTPEEVQKKYDLNVPVVIDPGMAVKCGVYSTPQAAIIDKNYKLHYRGNYNQSRYCTDEKTEFAKIALMALLQNNKHLVLNQYALKAYGCSLPNCNQ